jgi:hypothetical protein
MTSPVHHTNYALGARAPVLPPASAALFKRIWRVLEKNRQPAICEDVRERLLHRLAGPFSQSRAANAGPHTHLFWTSLRAITMKHVARQDPLEEMCDEDRVCAWLTPSCRWLSRGYAQQLVAEAGKSLSPNPTAVEVNGAPSSPAGSSSPADSRALDSSPSCARETCSPKSPSASGWALRWLDAIAANADPAEASNVWRSFLRAARKQRIGIPEWPTLLSRLAFVAPEKQAAVISELVSRARPSQMMELWQAALDHLEGVQRHQLLEQLGTAIASHSKSAEVLAAIGEWAPSSAPGLIQTLLHQGHVQQGWADLVTRQDMPVALRAAVLERLGPEACASESFHVALIALLHEVSLESPSQILKALLAAGAHLDRSDAPEELLDRCLQGAVTDASTAEAVASWLQKPSCPEAILSAGCRLAAKESREPKMWQQALAARPHGLSPKMQQLLWRTLETRSAQEAGAWVADLFCLPSWTRRKVTQWRDLVVEVLRGEKAAVASFVRGLEFSSPACRSQLTLELARHPIGREPDQVQRRVLGCWLQLQVEAEGNRLKQLPEGWGQLLLPQEAWAVDLIPLRASFTQHEGAEEADLDSLWADVADVVLTDLSPQKTDDDLRAVELTSTITEVLDHIHSHQHEEAQVDAAEESLVRLLVPCGLARIDDHQIAVAYGCAVDRFAQHLLGRLSQYVADLERAVEGIDRGEVNHAAFLQQDALPKSVSADYAKGLAGQLILCPARLNIIRRLLALCWEHPELAEFWMADLTERCEKSPRQGRELLVRKVAEEFSALDFEQGAIPSRALIEEFWKMWALVPARKQGAVGIRFMHQLLTCELRRPEALGRRSLDWILKGLDGISLATGNHFDTVVEQWSVLKHLFHALVELLDVAPEWGKASLSTWRRLTRQNFAAGLLRARSAPTAQILHRFIDEAIKLLHARDMRFTEITPISLVCEGILNRAGTAPLPPPESLASQALDELLVQCLDLPESEFESARDCWILCLRLLWQTPAQSRLPEERMLMGTLMSLLTMRTPLDSLERMLAEFLAEEIADVSDPALFQPMWQRIPLYSAGALRALRLVDRGEGFSAQITKSLAPLSLLLKQITKDPELNLAAVASDWRPQLSLIEARFLGGHLLQEASAEPNAVRARELTRFAVNVMLRSLGQPLLGQVLDWLRAEHPASALTDPSCPLSVFLHGHLGGAWLARGAAESVVSSSDHPAETKGATGGPF